MLNLPWSSSPTNPTIILDSTGWSIVDCLSSIPGHDANSPEARDHAILIVQHILSSVNPRG